MIKDHGLNFPKRGRRLKRKQSLWAQMHKGVTSMFLQFCWPQALTQSWYTKTTKFHK